jgi:hypothetical protein
LLAREDIVVDESTVMEVPFTSMVVDPPVNPKSASVEFAFALICAPVTDPAFARESTLREWEPTGAPEVAETFAFVVSEDVAFIAEYADENLMELAFVYRLYTFVLRFFHLSVFHSDFVLAFSYFCTFVL